MKRTLIWICFSGILAKSSELVWILRRATEPTRLLRQSASKTTRHAGGLVAPAVPGTLECFLVDSSTDEAVNPAERPVPRKPLNGPNAKKHAEQSGRECRRPQDQAEFLGDGFVAFQDPSPTLECAPRPVPQCDDERGHWIDPQCKMQLAIEDIGASEFEYRRSLMRVDNDRGRFVDNFVSSLKNSVAPINVLTIYVLVGKLLPQVLAHAGTDIVIECKFVALLW